MTLIEALIQVESQGNDYAIGDTHLADKAYGCLQIRKPCLDDVNRANGTSYEASQCLGNRTLSLWVFQEYMKLYATRKALGHEPTDKDRARIWNGGPRGWKRDSTLSYWNKVKRYLETLTRADYLAGLTNPTPSLTLEPWPKGNIVQGWGENPHLYATLYHDAPHLRRELGGHEGTDIQGPKRTPIYAAQEGNVVATQDDRNAVGGLCLWIDSPQLADGLEKITIKLVYGHFDECVVKLGDRIQKGQLLGYMGNTGMQGTSLANPYWKAPATEEGTHLHFGAHEYIWRAGKWVIRHPGPNGGSFDIMAYITLDTSYAKAFITRLMNFLKGRI